MFFFSILKCAGIKLIKSGHTNGCFLVCSSAVTHIFCLFDRTSFGMVFYFGNQLYRGGMLSASTCAVNTREGGSGRRPRPICIIISWADANAGSACARSRPLISMHVADLRHELICGLRHEFKNARPKRPAGRIFHQHFSVGRRQHVAAPDALESHGRTFLFAEGGR